jgi:WD40 repeat protein
MFMCKVKRMAIVQALALACIGVAGLIDGTPAAEQTPAQSEQREPARSVVAPAPTERFRQKGEAIALGFSPDGKVLAGYFWADADTRVILWDAVTGEEMWKLAVHGQGLHSRPFAFSPDGKIVAVVTFGFKIICCDVATGKQVRVLPLAVDGGIGPVLLRFSPDGKLLAVAAEADKVHVLDAVTGKCVQQVGGHHITIFGLAFSPDSKLLALGTLGPSLQLWEVASGKRSLSAEQQPKDTFATAVAFSPDGKTVAVGRCNSIALSEVATGRELGRLEAPMSIINDLEYIQNGKALVSGCRDGRVRIWDLQRRQVRCTLEGGGQGCCMAVYPDGRAVAVGTATDAIVWDLPSAHRDAPHKEVNLSWAALECLWSDLADPDAAKAHRALGTMLKVPEAAVTFLRHRVRPTPALTPEDSRRLCRLIAELDSDTFADRATAARELEKVGDQAAPILRQTLAANPSLEVRRRVEQLLQELDQHWTASSAENLRAWRVIKFLEYIGTPAARDALGKLAQGVPEDRVTLEAMASLRRLAQRTATASPAD